MSNSDVEQRLRFNEITGDVRASLRELRPFLKERLPGVLDRFYDHVRDWPEVASMFAGDERMRAASSRQLEHWMEIANAEFGDAYVRSAEKIGEVHARLGLEARWYIGAYTFISSRILHALMSEKIPGAGRNNANERRIRYVDAINRATLLDMDIVLTTIQAHAARARVAELHGLADRFETDVSGIVATPSAVKRLVRSR